MFYNEGGTFCRNRKSEKNFWCNIEDKKKKGQHEQKIKQVSVEEFDLNKEEVLISLKRAADDKILKIVNRNNKNSYRCTKNSLRWKMCHRQSD